MPIVEGIYEAKISTAFSAVDEGIEEIKRKIKKSRRIKINCIPMKSQGERRADRYALDRMIS